VTIDVRNLQTAHGDIIDLADPDIDQYDMWQIKSNLSGHTHPLIESNHPVFKLRGFTEEVFNNKDPNKKIIAVQFFIPTSGYANFDSAGNLYTDFSFRDQQIDFLISYFENFNDIDKSLCISFCDESPTIKDSLEILYNLMALYDIPEDRVMILGNNFAGQEVVNQHAKDNGEIPLKYIVGWWMLGHMDTIQLERIGDPLSNQKYHLNPVDTKQKQNTFTFLNRREVENRVALLWFLWERRIKAYKNIISAFPPLRLFGIDPNRKGASPSEGEVRNHYTTIFFQTVMKKFYEGSVLHINQELVDKFVSEMKLGKTIEGDAPFIGDVESKFMPLDNDAYIWLTCESTSELDEKNFFFTEKVLKPMAHGQALVVYAQPGFVDAFKQLGFYTLAEELGIDESYDSVTENGERMRMIADQIEQISTVPLAELHQRWLKCQDKVDHNRKLIFAMLSNLSTSHFMRNQSTYYVDNFLDNTIRSNTEQALKDYKDFFNVEDIFDN
tara:strand:+ start:1055 stop:2548 length:1494 start_codon:yes stop_codon:yes gene_type:complete